MHSDEDEFAEDVGVCDPMNPELCASHDQSYINF